MARTGDHSVLGQKTRITGRVSGQGALRIEGVIKGDVAVSGPLEIVEGSSVEGDVEAEALDLAGSLLGDVSARGPILVRAGATVRGELKGTRVAIEPGSRVAVRLECDFELDLGAPKRR